MSALCPRRCRPKVWARVWNLSLVPEIYLEIVGWVLLDDLSFHASFGLRARACFKIKDFHPLTARLVGCCITRRIPCRPFDPFDHVLFAELGVERRNAVAKFRVEESPSSPDAGPRDRVRLRPALAPKRRRGEEG